MANEPRSFRYDGDRSFYISAAAGFGFLLLIESSLMALLIAVFVSSVWLKLLLLAGLLALNIWAIRTLLAPLGAAHMLTEDELHLRYGAGVQAVLPRTALLAACPVRESVGGLSTLGARHDAERDRIVAVFSDQGQVLLTLTEPHSFQLGPFQRATARHLLINVDERDSFLAELNLPRQATSPTVSDADRHAPRLTPRANGRQPHGRPTDQQRPGAEEYALRTLGLTRRFGDFIAIDGLDLALYRGEIYGFLGPNGAGKTTTIKMIVGLLLPTAGRVLVDGHDVWADPLAAKAAFGFVPDRSLLYERLTGVEYLRFLAQMRSLPQAQAEPEIERLLDLLDLTDHADKLSSTYSFGMKRKLTLAGALLHRPPVLVLDEPLNGLDPRSARRLKDLFLDLAAEGKTVFLSTHDLFTAESVCHRVGIIHQGTLLAEGSAAEIRSLAAVPDLESAFLNLTTETAKEVRA